MANASFDGTGRVIMMDIVSLFSQQLNWHTDFLSVYLGCVNDVTVTPSGNGSDGSKG